MLILNDPILICPNCGEFIIIHQINCGIFRHGVFIKDGTQIEPHSSKEICEYYTKNNLIYGCGKPFQIIIENNKIKIFNCDYI